MKRYGFLKCSDFLLKGSKNMSYASDFEEHNFKELGLSELKLLARLMQRAELQSQLSIIHTKDKEEKRLAIYDMVQSADVQNILINIIQEREPDWKRSDLDDDIT
ncbi:MAG: hypothetical protein AAFY41_01995 [Bacteroidota bacterium]